MTGGATLRRPLNLAGEEAIYSDMKVVRKDGDGIYSRKGGTLLQPFYCAIHRFEPCAALLAERDA
jgi:hypothetical protein